MPATIRTITLLVLAVLLVSGAANALEGFKFLGEHSLALQTPTAIVSLAEKGFVVMESATRELVFFGPTFEETARTSLDEQLGYKAKVLLDLSYHPILGQIAALDPRQKKVLFLKLDGTLSSTIDLDIRGPAVLSSPSAMALDPSGMIYIGDRGDCDIKTFSIQGTYLFAMRRALDLKGRNRPLDPSSMAVLADGRLAVVDAGRSRLLVFSRAGGLMASKPLEGGCRRIAKLIATRSDQYVGFDGSARKICKWSSDGKLTSLFGARGQGRGQFGLLVDIACDPAGNVVALDTKSRRLQTFSFQAPVLALTGETPRPEYAVTFRSDTEMGLRVVSLLADGLVLFDPESRNVTVRRGRQEKTFSHDRFKDVTASFIGSERCCFFDRSRSEAYIFSTESAEFDVAFGHGGAGSLDNVTRILQGPDNTLYLADTDDTQVKIYSKDGIFSTKFGQRGKVRPEHIGRLSDIAWYDGKLAVLDGAYNVIHLFDSNGNFVENIKLQLPTEKVDMLTLGIDPNGFLAVLDNRNARILVFDENGRTMFQFGSHGRRPLDWASPVAFNVDNSGRVKVLDRIKPSRVLLYEVETPGPLSQAATAIAKSKWPAARKILQPYVAATDPTAATAMPGYERAMRLAVEADTRSKGKFLAHPEKAQATAYLGDVLDADPGNAPVRLALAASLKQGKKIEAAINLLRDGIASHPDARCEQALGKYVQELASSGSAKADVSIVECRIPVLLAALYQRYYDEPVIELTLANQGGKPTPPGKALFFAKAVMDNPTETDLPPLAPFSKKIVVLRAAFNRGILTYVEGTRLASRLEVRFGNGPSAIALDKNLTFELLGRNSIDWKQEEMISCFVTPKDPDVQIFARQALKTAEAQTIQADLDAHLYRGVTLFDAMQSVGLFYVPDPRQPFAFSEFSGKGIVDYLQFPRETLLRQSGDCDDLSVLYASLLEGSGIPTILVTSPGHIFAAFALKDGKKCVDALGLSPDLLVEYRGSHYVPVETTLLGSPFISAWRVAAATVKKNKAEIGFIDLKDAWTTYKTVPLPDANREVPVPEKTALSALLGRELDALNLRQVEKRLAIYKKWLEREPMNVSIVLLLARAYSEVGVFDLALEFANRAKLLQPESADVYQVIGNVAYMQNDYAGAVKLYQQAEKLAPTPAIQINLALAYLKGGQVTRARKAFAEAKKRDEKIAAEYPELGQLLE